MEKKVKTLDVWTSCVTSQGTEMHTYARNKLNIRAKAPSQLLEKNSVYCGDVVLVQVDVARFQPCCLVTWWMLGNLLNSHHLV